MNKNCYIKKIGTTLLREIRHCKICQYVKQTNKYLQANTKAAVSTYIKEMAAADYLGLLPKAKGNHPHILLMVDLFSKLVKLCTLRSLNTRNTINKVGEYFRIIRKPKNLQQIVEQHSGPECGKNG